MCDNLYRYGDCRTLLNGQPAYQWSDDYTKGGAQLRIRIKRDRAMGINISIGHPSGHGDHVADWAIEDDLEARSATVRWPLAIERGLAGSVGTKPPFDGTKFGSKSLWCCNHGRTRLDVYLARRCSSSCWTSSDFPPTTEPHLSRARMGLATSYECSMRLAACR